MKVIRNPFFMKYSEKIDSGDMFLKLFEPEVLDVLDKENIWNSVQIIRSSPGGGKTTLFHVFTPNVLNTLYRLRTMEDYNECYKKLEHIDAISNTGPSVLGVIVSCARNYVVFDDIISDANLSKALFFTLFNSRIIMAIMRSALELKGLSFPADVGRIRITYLPDELHHMFTVSEDSCVNGKDIYEWACNKEKSICGLIDSFDIPNKFEINGASLNFLLYSLLLYSPESLLVDNEKVADKILIMFDDVHKLSYRQRKEFIDQLFELRPKISIWMAERLEVLGTQDFFGSNGIVGREYNEPIYLETKATHTGKKFEKILLSIADKRVKLARSTRISSFRECLKNELPVMDIKFNKVLENIINELLQRIKNKTKNSSDYKEWINKRETYKGSLSEIVIALRTLEIIIDRDLNNAQLKLDLGIPYPYDELTERENKSQSIKEAAELYLAKEFYIPYYFGIDMLTKLSCHNIEQFLYFAGELFEESISAELIKKDYALTPEKQERILKRAAAARWNDIPRRIPYGNNVKSLLESICKFALKDFQKGTASYNGGGAITGIALSTRDCENLLQQEKNNVDKAKKLVSDVLSACIAYNLIDVKTNIKQGGKEWTVMYLNSWICLHFGLPFQHGGWKHKSLNEIYKWCNPNDFKETDLDQLSIV